MAATPPMKTAVPTPPSPLHGGRYETYHATRKSTRQTATRRTRVTETPPPVSSKLPHKSQSSSQKNPTTTHSAGHFNSPPPSTHTSPRKKAKKSADVQSTSAMNGEDSSRAPSEDPFYNPTQNPMLQQPSLQIGANMLPTPVKTPRKKPIGQAALNVGGRVLFPDRPEDPMPVPRKIRKGKRHVGFSLYSSMEDQEHGPENQISIYTDSKDKVPELDLSEDNPFLDKPDEVAPPPEPGKGRGNRKRKASYGLDGSKEIEEAFNREEGMVYVFRGKKVYRKFPEEEPEGDEDDDATAEDALHPNSRPRSLTRSSIKPRLLFPTASQKAHCSKSDIEAEEAPTDIDDPDATETSHDPKPQTRTPVKSTFRGLPPDTPPDTGHATRSATKKAAKAGSSSASSPAISPVKIDFGKPPKGKKVSPFDGWARTKPGAATTTAKGKKRAAEEAGEEDAERLKETTVKRPKPNAV